jgi:hypothetical protein
MPNPGLKNNLPGDKQGDLSHCYDRFRLLYILLNDVILALISGRHPRLCQYIRCGACRALMLCLIVGLECAVNASSSGRLDRC